MYRGDKDPKPGVPSWEPPPRSVIADHECLFCQKVREKLNKFLRGKT